MIAIISTAPRERAALEALCKDHRWPVVGCDSVRAFKRLLAKSTPKVVLTRGHLADGFGDKVLFIAPPGARKVVLLAAGTPSGIEARTVLLGADCVLRDPVRIDVLREYLAKYMSAAAHQPAISSAPKFISLAGMNVDVMERQLHGTCGLVQLTPREIALARILVEAEGEVVTYELLYQELMGRSFDGDTSNMRVLLGKLTTSGEKAGTDLRKWIDVIPKTGYRYHGESRDPIGALSAPPPPPLVATLEDSPAGLPNGSQLRIVGRVTEKLH